MYLVNLIFISEDVCDPAIDEHFRRSLGKDYSSIFSKDKQELNKSENSESDSTGLTGNNILYFLKLCFRCKSSLTKCHNYETCIENL